MNRKRIGATIALAVASAAVVLAVTPLGGAAVRHVSMLIAPTSKSAVGNVNAFNNWGTNGCSSICSRDGFSSVSHFDTGIYCLTGRTNPDASMLKLTADNQHSNTVAGSLAWDRSSPDCSSSQYEVFTYDSTGVLSDDVAFYAEAYKRA